MFSIPRIFVVTVSLAACSQQQPRDNQLSSPDSPEAQSSPLHANAGNEVSSQIDRSRPRNSDAPDDDNARSDRDKSDNDMVWSFSRTVAGPKLAYGEPQTDNVKLNLRCDGDRIVLHFMRSAGVVSRRPDQLVIASGGMQWRSGVSAEESQLGGMSISANAPASSAPITAFHSGSPLEIRWGEERILVPGTDKAKEFLSACR